MTTVNAMQIVNEAIEAHGGTAYWNGLEALDVVMSAKGFLFTAQPRPEAPLIVRQLPRPTFYILSCVPPAPAHAALRVRTIG